MTPHPLPPDDTERPKDTERHAHRARRRHRLRLLRQRPGLALAASAAVAVTSFGLTMTSATAQLPATEAGWHEELLEDFNGADGSPPSPNNWIISTGTQYEGGPARWGTNEVQTYTSSPDNVKLNGKGELEITPRRNGTAWTSARIETKRTDFKAPAGGVLRIEASIKLPNVTGEAATGYWPAFWTLGSPFRGDYQNWPTIGEFDILENANGINRIWGTLHCGDKPKGGLCNEPFGFGSFTKDGCPGSPCQGNFHTYRFEWDRTVETAQVLRWSVDGQEYHTVKQSQVHPTAWQKLSEHAGYFILLNVAMGGDFPKGVGGDGNGGPGGGDPTPATVPGHPMTVDYVGVWTKTADGGGGGGGDDVRDAYATIQAESSDGESGVTKFGDHVGALANGDWVRFDKVDFGTRPPIDVVARAASGAAPGISGLVEIRVDSPSSPPIGTIAIGNTGGWTSWRDIPMNVGAVTGIHPVYLTFTSGQPNDFVNIDWFRFRH
jgi:beta-glucanase (GH16 family)